MLLEYLVKLFLHILKLLGFPEIVCLCGSTGKALEAFRSENLTLTKQGKIVLSIGCDTKSDSDLQDEHDIASLKDMLDALHRRKILLAYTVYILNKGGYIGTSTLKEYHYAKRLRKPILWLEPEYAIQ